MKKVLFNLMLTCGLAITMSSCYVNSFAVGNGAQGNTEVKEMNSYFILGLAPGNVKDPQQMAGGAKDYNVTIKHTFVDGLLAAITFGIFTPTTTIVTK